MDKKKIFACEIVNSYFSVVFIETGKFFMFISIFLFASFQITACLIPLQTACSSQQIQDILYTVRKLTAMRFAEFIS